MDKKRDYSDITSNILKSLIIDLYKFNNLYNEYDYNTIIICKYNPGLSKNDRFVRYYHVIIEIPKNIKVKR